MLASVPKNNLYLNAAVQKVVPFDYLGVEFALETTQVGNPVIIEIERFGSVESTEDGGPNRITVIPEHQFSQIRLPLSAGVNRLTITHSTGEFTLRVGVDPTWAAGLYAISKDIEGIDNALRDRRYAATSPTGSLFVERWFKDRDILPGSASLHRLAMRMFIDGITRPASEIGVEKVTTALTGSTPVLKRNHGRMYGLDGVDPMFLSAEEFAGYDHHVWLLNLCSASFVAAGHYFEAFPWRWSIEEFSEAVIALSNAEDADDTRIIALRNPIVTPSAGICTVEDALLGRGCFDRFRPWVRITTTTEFVICMAQYPLGVQVDPCKSLGMPYWGCEDNTLESIITDPDSVDEEDPTGNGWIEQNLSGRWDYPYGSDFDTIGEVEAFLASEIDCSYERGVVSTPLMTTRTDTTVNHEMTAFGSQTVTTYGADGPILCPM